MIALEGYSITERLTQGRTTVVYRGKRLSDGAPIIAKVLDLQYPTPLHLARILREYELLAGLDHPGIIKVYAVERSHHTLAIIMEDFGGVPLSAVIAENKLSLNAKLAIARRIADILGDIHARNIIHKDINPNNILLSEDRSQIKIIDFGIASQLLQENPQLDNAELLEGTLAYISPEQTGRMNRPIDYRSDLYSFGITIYELLLGQLPFEAQDSVEMVHLHMAAIPASLHSRDPAIPEAVSRIVLKLIEKNAENRYRGAIGVARDLDICLRGVDEDFVPGQYDRSDRFTVPTRLYGREDEVRRLFGAYEAACNGQPGVLLVTGYSGIGKSSLINEIHRPITKRAGFFIAGKFDQYRRNIPYSSLIEAFQSLLHQILAESEEKIALWRTRLLDALGVNGQVIIDVLPDLQYIIGPQPEIAALAPQEAQNRFNYYFINFIRTFVDEQYPLVLFLDDLQWADNPSLNLIELLSVDKDCRHLLILGAYRSNEVAAAHPLALSLGRMASAGASVHEIALQPLSVEAVGELVADTVNRPLAEARPLAALIARKTDGNPFFIGQLLKTLHSSGLITYDDALNGWIWQLEKIQSIAVSDNVAALMVANIQSFPDETRQLLQLAACIGNQFTLHDLAVVGEDSWDNVAENVLVAVKAGLISPIGNEYRFYGGEEKARAGDFSVRYRFLHDRVQQAAYDFLGDTEKARTHFKAGQMLLGDTPEERLGDKIFDIVNHFNLAADLATDPALRRRLSQLNLQAALKAKNSIAYEPALKYVNAARAFLGEIGDPPLLFDILVEQAECEYLNGNGDAAEVLYRQALERASGDKDKAFVYERMIHYYTNTGKFRAAYDTGRQALRLFGVALPASFIPPLFLIDLARVKWKLRGRKIESLIDLPLCQDERLITAMRLIGAVQKAAYQVRPELCIASAIKAVDISLTHGTMEDNAVAYVVLGGIFIGGVMGSRQAGYEFGRLALAMNDRFDNLKLSAEVNFVSAYFTNFWVEPAKNTEKFYRIAYEAGLQTGDFFHLSCAACTLVESQFIRGVRLDDLRKTGEDYQAFMDRIKSHEASGAISAVLRTIDNLEGLTGSPASFGDDEDDYLKTLDRFTSRHFAHFYFVNKMQALYLWGLVDEALKTAEISETYLKHSVAMLHTAEHYFYHGLILCAAFRQSGKASQLKKARKILRKLEGWAKLAPSNFAHKALLLQAELARSGKSGAKLAALYVAAIHSAGASGYAQNEALANELAGRYFAVQGIEMAALGHLRAALYGYRMWGADGLADRLSAEFPQLESQSPLDAVPSWLDPAIAAHHSRSKHKSHSNSRSRTAGSRTQSSLDLETVIKATRALSEEIKLQTLLRKLVEIMIENAGAQRGAFIRLDQGQPLVEAAGVAGETSVSMPGGEPLDGSEFPLSLVQYVARLGESVLLNDAQHDERFWKDPYIQAVSPKSVLCAPVIHQGQVAGIIYLENNLTSGAFTASRLEMLEVLSAQAAVSLENSTLYGQLEQRVTERTSELLLATEKLKAASQAKSQFLATMSHEIRTPMMGVQGMLDLLRHTALTEDQREMVSVVRDSAAALLTIINDILDFSKIEAGKMQLEYVPLALGELVESVVEVLAPTAYKKGLSFTPIIDPAIPQFLSGDPVRLRQILFNLVGNAIKFTSQGSVVIRVEQVSHGDNSATIRLAVIDSGVGITPEAQERLFRPFSQADETTTRRFGGTGLGLSICRHLVDLMGGTIGIESQLGEGATFSVVLTLSRVDAPPEDQQPTLGGARIAVTLAGAAETEATSRTLAAAGAVIVAADDAPDLVIADGTNESGASIIRITKPGSQGSDTALARPSRRATLLRTVSAALGRAAVAAPVAHAPASATPIDPTDTRLILVAEDNPVNRMVIKRLLKFIGRNADLVENGQQALEAWRTGRYTLILSDCHMPEMDGFALTRAIRQEEAGSGRRTPIIAFTAAATTEEVTQCTEAGMDDILSKPVDMERLKATLAHWLDRVPA